MISITIINGFKGFYMISITIINGFYMILNDYYYDI
jgi:uncharacterized protein YlzI (FlbEa/FlbD family)